MLLWAVATGDNPIPYAKAPTAAGAGTTECPTTDCGVEVAVGLLAYREYHGPPQRSHDIFLHGHGHLDRVASLVHKGTLGRLGAPVSSDCCGSTWPYVALCPVFRGMLPTGNGPHPWGLQRLSVAVLPLLHRAHYPWMPAPTWLARCAKCYTE